MKLLNTAQPENILEHHRWIPVRNYDSDGIQEERISRAKDYVTAYLRTLPGIELKTIVELGCGTGSISGAFSHNQRVIGVDISLRSLIEAKKRFPNMTLYHKDLESLEPMDCDLLVLSETLEHLKKPIELVQKWLPLAKAAIISHPLDESLNSNISGGDHLWSYDLHDFNNWFREGKHHLELFQRFQMGLYEIGMGLSYREANK